jgi:hypothetical protein
MSDILKFLKLLDHLLQNQRKMMSPSFQKKEGLRWIFLAPLRATTKTDSLCIRSRSKYANTSSYAIRISSSGESSPLPLQIVHEDDKFATTLSAVVEQPINKNMYEAFHKEKLVGPADNTIDDISQSAAEPLKVDEQVL